MILISTVTSSQQPSCLPLKSWAKVSAKSLQHFPSGTTLCRLGCASVQAWTLSLPWECVEGAEFPVPSFLSSWPEEGQAEGR